MKTFLLLQHYSKLRTKYYKSDQNKNRFVPHALTTEQHEDSVASCRDFFKMCEK